MNFFDLENMCIEALISNLTLILEFSKTPSIFSAILEERVLNLFAATGRTQVCKMILSITKGLIDESRPGAKK